MAAGRAPGSVGATRYGAFVADWVSIGISVASGLFGGSLGSVLVAPLIGDRLEHGKRRHAAKASIRTALLACLSTLRYDLDDRDVRPLTYASLESQERLAEVLVRELPHLTGGMRRRLHERLEHLVGTRTVARAKALAHLPATDRDADKEQRRIEVAERRIMLLDGEAETYGQLGVVRRSPNEPAHHEHHAAAVATLQLMLDDVGL
ncbi:hypothetical protein CFP75_23865 [Amycolatopsis alba DSM 44262]|uniref:Uncharacterized protein n=1 Tax=Amycolatopsis alba DSM 44262 TaxID=1125972 RepID=A0A229RLJ6_AMYAL|nr:hypothetical protein CFP75_23865 [Amycolatopsis alba DSM 44262]